MFTCILLGANAVILRKWRNWQIMQRKTILNKKRGVVSAVLALTLLTASSLAWRDVSQHKTNKFLTSGVEHNVTLVENFQEVTNWRIGQTMKKEVSVRNGQQSDDPSKYLYEDALIRVQFKEYMEIGSKNYVFNQDRLMINTAGDFIRFTTEQAAREYMSANTIPNEARITRVKGYYDGPTAPADGYYYIATQLQDQNGQYGKYLVTGIENSNAVSIVDGIAKGNPGSNHTTTKPNTEQTGTDRYKVDESAWSVHTWGRDEKLGNAQASAFTEYVKWSLGNDVITFDAWDKKPVDKWILDTNSEQGWAYWGKPLEHGQSAIEKKTITSKILESVELIKQPSGMADYFVHVNMDAVSAADLNKWTDAPGDILASYKNQTDANASKIVLKKSMDEASLIDSAGISSPSGVELRAALANADAVYNSNYLVIKDIVAAKERLDQAVERFLNDAANGKRLAFNKKLTDAAGLDITNKTKQSAQLLRDTIAEGRLVQANVNAGDDQIDAMSAKIDQAIAKLNVLVGLEAYPTNVEGTNNHYYVSYAGAVWEVVGRSLNNVGLRLAPLSVAQYQEMGITDLLSKDRTNEVFNQHNVMNFSDDKNATYENSKPYQAITAFYNTYIKGKAEEDLIVPVYLDKENKIDDTDYSAQTAINDDRGTKQAFLPSRYDNIRGHRAIFKNFTHPNETPIWGGGAYWDRSSKGDQATRSWPQRNTNVLVSKTDFYFQIRPMVVVKNVTLPFADSSLN